MNLNKLQLAALSLIQSDACFLYTLVDVQKNAKNVSSNYIMMCQPYIGVFVDGAEQWCKKVGLEPPALTNEEKMYYTELRQGHKLFEKTYNEYSRVLCSKFNESDSYFYNKRSAIEKIFGYYNVGTDLCNGEFCGNTIICALNTPIKILGNENVGNTIMGMSVIAGKLAAYMGCIGYSPYNYRDSLIVSYKDYHFFKNCPLKLKTSLGLELFSILCVINYAIVFVEQFFIDEIPQKFKFAYLQYYYLCDFVKEINEANNIKIKVDNSLKNRTFRNCLAHYGLGQFLSEEDLMVDDVLKGLTNKAFGMDYMTTKEILYKFLSDLAEQIKDIIF